MMELTVQSLYPFLDQLPQPVLHLKDEELVFANKAGRRALLLPGLHARDLMADTYEVYHTAAPDEEMALPLRCGTAQYRASLFRYPDGDLLVLQEDPELHGLTPVGQQNLAAALRNILVGVIAPMQELFPYLEEQENEFVQDRTASLSRSYFRMLRAVALIGDTGAMEMGDFTASLERTELCNYVYDLAERCRAFTEEHKISLDVHLPPKLFFGYIDRDQIERAVYNLVSNSVKYTPAGGKVDITLQHEENLGVLTVRDNGAGMDSDLLQNATVRNRQPGIDARWGVGFGLQLARAIAQLHGGNLMIRSQPGKGTSVTISFVLQPAQEPPVLDPAMRFDYASGLDHAHVEFADVMPDSAYDSRCI